MYVRLQRSGIFMDLALRAKTGQTAIFRKYTQMPGQRPKRRTTCPGKPRRMVTVSFNISHNTLNVA